ncbi:MAG: hypothetical protein DWB42_13430 [Chloroflexi bacterium]|nr:hypothetical protein [Chloroflexota bacterium]MDL1883691.1 hypothetical protein [Anaerolineae bacterium CFX8]
MKQAGSSELSFAINHKCGAPVAGESRHTVQIFQRVKQVIAQIVKQHLSRRRSPGIHTALWVVLSWPLYYEKYAR